ncbi:MAG: hypothetical protein O3A84_03170 [Proteobacteria bacterium]|nr:hypothetical protein [Pseudomonadota bacterium]
MTKHHVHVVGSVPLHDAETTFKTLSETLGPYLLRIPDGETGPRLDWIRFLEPVFADNPVFEPTDEEFLVHGNAGAMRRYRLKAGTKPEDVQLGNLMYADNAIESYKVFSRLVEAGVIPAHCRFQVDFAPGHSPCRAFVVEADRPLVEPLFDKGLKGEIDRIAAAIPHDKLAIQFDTASAVFFHLERGVPTHYGETKDAMLKTFVAQVVNLGDHVPPGIELIYHLCYGDNNHKHSIEPTDMSDLVAFSNTVSAQISRTIELIHMPVPRDRDDDAYFTALQGLRLRPETQVSLGLVHHTDGIDGTRQRIAVAQKYLNDFMIASECGFGRRDPATLPELLRIHATIAEAG